MLQATSSRPRRQWKREVLKLGFQSSTTTASTNGHESGLERGLRRRVQRIWRGVITTAPFAKGDIVLDYHGLVINSQNLRCDDYVDDDPIN